MVNIESLFATLKRLYAAVSRVHPAYGNPMYNELPVTATSIGMITESMIRDYKYFTRPFSRNLVSTCESQDTGQATAIIIHTQMPNADNSVVSESHSADEQEAEADGCVILITAEVAEGL
jgi:hypothetical protein